MFFKKKQKYKAIFVKHIQNSYVYQGKKRFSTQKDEISFHNKVISIKNIGDIEPFTKNFINYYFIDVNSGLIKFNETPNQIDFELVNQFVGKRVYYNLIGGIFNSGFGKILPYILGGLIGVFGGLFVGVYLL